MLVSLHIRNFALIENATIRFDEGLNILSGETGAGKSIIIQALEILLGGRGSSDLIREGEEEAEVVGVFHLKDREVSLRRAISQSGRSRAFVDERPVTVSVLEGIGDDLVDIAGQHTHQILLQPERHLSLLDEFAELTHEVAAYHGTLSSYRSLLEEKNCLMAREREAREKEDFLRFQLKELSEASLKEGEEEELQREKEIQRHAVRLGEICIRGEEALDSGEDSITLRMARLSKEIQQVSELDPELATIGDQMEAALCELKESARRLQSFGKKISFDPERLQTVEDRLALISRLKKKYGGSLGLILEKEKEVQESLSLLDHFEEEIQKKESELAKAGKEILKQAENFSKKRGLAAAKLSKEVERELKDLGMRHARFFVAMEPMTAGSYEIEGRWLGEAGLDTAEFMIEPNPGEGARPLAKIASGGEISRIFLAIKKVMGGIRPTATCVFDEVDSGIGGGIAEVIGRNLSLLARKRQVICITHLPQIACYGDHHFMIQKKTEKGRTQTQIERLQSGAREEEIARMLAGLKITDKAMAHAREMLRHAAQQIS